MFTALVWAHFTNVLAQIIVKVIKTRATKWMNLVRFLQIILLFSYGPLYYVFYLAALDPNFEKYNTVEREWMMIEIMVFRYWIFSSIAFLLLTYIFKFRGGELRANIRHRDIWKLKDTDDYLNFMRMPYKNFCMFWTFFTIDFLLLLPDWHP